MGTTVGAGKSWQGTLNRLERSWRNAPRTCVHGATDVKLLMVGIYELIREGASVAAGSGTHLMAQSAQPVLYFCRAHRFTGTATTKGLS
jgi:hypothetical protein